MSWIILIFISLYTLLIGAFAIAQGRLPIYNRIRQEKKEGLSILIPFRDEARNLPRVLKSIAVLEYPTDFFEVILIDDDSSDDSEILIKDFITQHPSLSISCLKSKRTSGSPKKDALSLGIRHANYGWIVTTDADCALEKTCLQSLNYCIQKYHPKMIVAPVSIARSHPVSFLNAYEQLDFLSLMGATIGGFGMRLPFLCNGANLAYEKEAFIAVHGYQNNDHIASGDDHFLLEKFVQTFPKKVHYLNTLQAGVTTQPQATWKALLSQRLRWASKTSQYTFWFSKIVGILVLFTNIIAVLLLSLLPFTFINETAFPQALPGQLIVCTLFVKYAVDLLLIARTAAFFNRKNYLKWYPIVMVCHPFITVYIGIKSLTSSFQWKGRRYKQ